MLLRLTAVKTSAVPGQSCAVNLVPVSTAQRRRRRVEKTSCLSSLVSLPLRGLGVVSADVSVSEFGGPFRGE